MDVHALLRRLRAGESNNRIARMLHVDRKTVRKYRRWAERKDLLRGLLPDLATLEAQLRETYKRPARRGKISTMEPWRDEIQSLLDKGLGPKLIFDKLSQREDFDGSESAVWRMTRQLRPATPDVTVRVETSPGEEAQVDFGDVGKLFDPLAQRLRKAWVFVMVLSWSPSAVHTGLCATCMSSSSSTRKLRPGSCCTGMRSNSSALSHSGW